MKKALACAAIVALTACAPQVYVVEEPTFTGKALETSTRPMPRQMGETAWIVPLVAILAILASSKGGSEESIDPCSCKDVSLIPGDVG